MVLSPCLGCNELFEAGTCVCPHCGRKARCRSRTLSPAAALLGLSLAAGCVQAQPVYGETQEPGDFDEDGDGWAPNDGDCDDDDPDIHPEAEELPGDGVDSNCDGNDDT